MEEQYLYYWIYYLCGRKNIGIEHIVWYFSHRKQIYKVRNAQIIWETAKNIINSSDNHTEIKTLDSDDVAMGYDKEMDVICFESIDRMLNFIFGDEKMCSKENLQPLVIIAPTLGLDSSYAQKILSYCGKELFYKRIKEIQSPVVHRESSSRYSIRKNIDISRFNIVQFHSKF